MASYARVLGVLLALAAQGAPKIEVITVGAGDDLFSHFGHAAVCIHEPGEPSSACYNYGTADFSTPIPLTYRFLRGEAEFWVSVHPRSLMIETFRREDRSIYSQTLRLPDPDARKLAELLRASTAPDMRRYLYHHFRDNCTTRIRDALDTSLGGRLKAETSTVVLDVTFRDYAREGFVGILPLQILTELILGRPADARMSEWDAMFLPRDFQKSLSPRAPPVVIYSRKGPALAGNPRAGSWALALTGLGLGLLALSGSRALRVLVFSVLGLAGSVLHVLALFSGFPELRLNENLMVLLPTDLLLVGATNQWTLRYAKARVGGLALVIVLLTSGILIQPLVGPITLVLPALLALLARAHGRADRDADTHDQGADALDRGG
ncbi:MAG: DUF4105 domain-containing protein [Deltaproteobacteria bacterium]|nr:DUF4105 domain-containing protein [Deltaproteobacteria bacterium]